MQEEQSPTISAKIGHLRGAQFGVVLLKDWIFNPNTGSDVRALSGTIELVVAKESFGFQPKGNETNWGVRVGVDEESVLVLGCQIRGVYWGKQISSPSPNCWSLPCSI